METNKKLRPTKALILSTHDDFTLEPLGATLIKEDVLFEDNNYYGLWEIEIHRDITLKAIGYLFNSYLAWYQKNDCLGDDVYYDYLPDAIDQILMLASQEHEMAFEFAKITITTDEFLLRHNDPEEPLLYPEAYTYEYYKDLTDRIRKQFS